MYRNKKISLCLPCRNEADNIPAIMAAIPELVDEVILVSNCSSDNTVEVGRASGALVYEDNRSLNGIGYGFAHMTGLNNATGDIIIGADCDGTYPLEKIPEIVKHLINTKLDFVSCNRYPLQNGSKIPLVLQAGVRLLNLEVRALYQRNIKDILSGMWALDSSVLLLLNMDAGDWNFSPQIKLEAALNPEVRFGEFSITQAPRLGKSHQAYLKTGISHTLWIAKNRLDIFGGRRIIEPVSDE